ncbi:hypothetical protein LU679_30280, partial [Pseudomonas putida]|nr:hypothetical protein [Pseudomonas putida]
MLVTQRTKLRGQFLALDSLNLFWDSASLNPDCYYFVVEGSGFVNGCLGMLRSTCRAAAASCNFPGTYSVIGRK